MCIRDSTWPRNAGHVSRYVCGPDGTMNAEGRAYNQQRREGEMGEGDGGDGGAGDLSDRSL